MQIANTLPELIGNTPLLRLERFAPGAGVLAKLESFNPLSSAKDRAGLYMILDAEERGLLQPGAVIVEPTSGNTGVALAYIGRQRGYRVVLTMPETMSQERRSLLAALGAELVLTEGARGMGGAIERAKELLESTPGAWMPDQFNNPANARAHYETTGPELWRDTDGGVDVLVAGVGSGGTITGAGRYLKEQNPAIRVVAVEPAESPVLSGGRPGPHKIQGIGAGFVPGTLDMGVVDEVVAVTGDEAYAAARELARTEGVLAGVSSGAAAHAARILAQRPDMRGKTIAVVLPDTGERYLSTGLFASIERGGHNRQHGSGRRRFACGRSHIMYGAGPPGRHGRGSDSAGASFSAGPPGSGFESTGTPPPGRCPENRPPPGGSAG